jgi:ABC-type oligopeptide transport system ATPase subunit
MTSSELLLSVRGLKKHFPSRGAVVKAVDDISFDVRRGSIVGLVGESGSGKTTAGRSILRLIEPSDGEVVFDGVDVTKLSDAEMRAYRKRMQIVFQDPYSSLNPRLRVSSIIGEALDAHRLAKGGARKDRVAELLTSVGLPAEHASRYPHEFSGGQRQRIGIARALATNPKIVIADEPVSALDVSIQAQVVNLMQDLQEEFGLSYIFIAHDLSVIRHISDRIAVMFKGEIVEIGEAENIYQQPQHAYSRTLLAAVPRPDPERSRRKRVGLA